MFRSKELAAKTRQTYKANKQKYIPEKEIGIFPLKMDV
jgi:hypothetical protein